MGVGSAHGTQALEDHSQVTSPEECQTHSHGMDPPAQTGSCRRNPEVEGRPICAPEAIAKCLATPTGSPLPLWYHGQQSGAFSSWPCCWDGT